MKQPMSHFYPSSVRERRRNSDLFRPQNPCPIERSKATPARSPPPALTPAGLKHIPPALYPLGPRPPTAGEKSAPYWKAGGTLHRGRLLSMSMAWLWRDEGKRQQPAGAALRLRATR